MYGDTERFYCFGCGVGGDVLDFVQRVENLSLPDAIQRLDGGLGLVSGAAVRPVPARRPRATPLPPRDPALLTAAVRFYAGQLRRSPAAWEYLASRGVGLDASLRLGLGYAPGSGLREALESDGFTAERLRDCGLFTERGERFAGMVVVPDASGGLVRWLVGRAIDPDRTPRFQALPGSKPVLGLGRLGPAPPFAVVAEGVFDWLALAQLGRPRQSLPWAPRGSRRWRRACGAAPGSSSPSTRTTLDLRPRNGLRACLDAGPPPSPFPRASATWPSLRPFPTAAPSSSACWLRRHAPPASGFFPASHSPGPLPLYRSLARSGLACGTPSRFTPFTTLTLPRRTYAQFTTGLARARPPVGESAPAIRYRQRHHKKETRHGEQERKQQRRHSNGHRHTASSRSTATGRTTRPRHQSDGHELLWDGLLARSHQRPGAAPRPRAGLPAQGARRQGLRLPRRPRRR